MDEYTVTINLSVHDPMQLRAQAIAHAVTQDGLARAEARELVGTRDNINVEACLGILLDPGSLPGCSIHGHWAERF